MRSIRTFLFAILIPLQADACLQTSGTTIHGGLETGGYNRHIYILQKSLNESPTEHLAKLDHDSLLEPSDDFSPEENAGVKNVFKGNYDLAISELNDSEAKHPGRYTTAANLGAAFELNGELDLALKWISEGIRRNPDSHGGTEWLHVEIIKTRMKLKENPDYLRQHHVIEIPDTSTATSEIEIDGKRYTTDQVIDSLFYQLKERMLFVKPKDPVVADLLFIYGVLEGQIHVVESGLQLLLMAQDYGFQDPALLSGNVWGQCLGSEYSD